MTPTADCLIIYNVLCKLWEWFYNGSLKSHFWAVGVGLLKSLIWFVVFSFWHYFLKLLIYLKSFLSSLVSHSATALAQTWSFLWPKSSMFSWICKIKLYVAMKKDNIKHTQLKRKLFYVAWLYTVTPGVTLSSLWSHLGSKWLRRKFHFL